MAEVYPSVWHNSTPRVETRVTHSPWMDTGYLALAVVGCAAMNTSVRGPANCFGLTGCFVSDMSKTLCLGVRREQGRRGELQCAPQDVMYRGDSLVLILEMGTGPESLCRNCMRLSGRQTCVRTDPSADRACGGREESLAGSQGPRPLTFLQPLPSSCPVPEHWPHSRGPCGTGPGSPDCAAEVVSSEVTRACCQLRCAPAGGNWALGQVGQSHSGVR